MNEFSQHLQPSALGPALVGGPGRRVGDAERAACCETLSEHFAAGRLRADELDLRLDAAVRAVTEVDLRRLVADLPVARPVARPATAPVAAASWPAVTVLAVIVFAVSVLVAGGLLLVLGAVNPLLFVGACLGGGAAFAGGVSGTVLWQRGHRWAAPDRPSTATR